MNQEEFLTELEKRVNVINIIQKRLDMAKRSLDALYAKRAKTITEVLKLKADRKYTLTYRVKDVGINMTKEGFFYSVEYSPKHENFVIRLKPLKKNGAPMKQPEPLGDAVLITDIVDLR